MRLCGIRLLVVTVACALCSPPLPLAAQAGRSGPSRRLYSIRDVVGWSVEQVVDELREVPRVASVEVVTSPSRVQALATARQIAVRRSSPALRAFLDTTRQDPSVLRKLAAYASVNGGEGAMALLLAAERRRPGDWATQYNVAAFLVLEGYPRAALALLDSLRAPPGARGPGGIDLQASLLLGRGNALLALGRSREAVPLLREARQREPLLSEAARALALAHLRLGDETEAKRVLLSVGRRYLTPGEMVEGGEVPPITDATIQIDDAMLQAAWLERTNQTTLNERWPLSKGRWEDIKLMPPPDEPQALDPFLQRIRDDQRRLSAAAVAAGTSHDESQIAYGMASGDWRRWALPELRAKLRADVTIPWGTLPPLIGNRCAVDVVDERGFQKSVADRKADEAFAVERLEDEDLATHAWQVRRRAADVCARLGPDYWAKASKALTDALARCGSTPSCACSLRLAASRSQLTAVNGLYQPYMAAVKAWYRLAHHHSTAIVGYVERDDRTLATLARAEIARHETSIRAWLHLDMMLLYGSVTKACRPEGAPSLPDSVPAVLASWDVNPCAAADGVGIKQDFVVAEVKVSCYDVEVEGKVPLALPGFSAVGSLTYSFGGKDAGSLTIFTGAAAGTPSLLGAGTGVKAGTYITIQEGKIADGGGYAVDGGFKLSAEATVGSVAKEVSQSVSAKDTVLGLAGSATYVSDSFLAIVGY